MVFDRIKFIKTKANVFGSLDMALNTLKRYGEAFAKGWRPQPGDYPLERAISHLIKIVNMVRTKLEAASICCASDLSERRLACSCYLCFWDLIDLQHTLNDAIASTEWRLAAKVHSLSDSIADFFEKEIIPWLETTYSFHFYLEDLEKVVNMVTDSYGPLS